MLCSVIDDIWHQNFVRTKKWHIRFSLACSSCQLLTWSRIANGTTVVEEWKSEGNYRTVHYCAIMFYSLNASNKLGAVECVTDVLSTFWKKEAIKMQVEFSLLCKTFLMVEVRSKIFKAKGGTIQVLTIVDILSMTKAIESRKLCLVSFLFLLL